jgi:hypothetical protein
MDDRDCLAFYPYVVVRIACRVCSRTGSYRLARLAAKFGPEISLRDLTDRFSYDCLWRAEARSKRVVELRRLFAGPRAAAPPGRSALSRETAFDQEPVIGEPHV